MRGLLVRGGGVGRAVDLDEDETRGIVGLLDDVKTGDAGFAHTLAGVRETRGGEGLDASGSDVDVDMNDEHGVSGFYH
jgi:hypothetical protein